MKQHLKNRDGFTLIELLVVIGIIAVLAGIVIIAINPARQFAQARNTQRWSNVQATLNAVGQRSADNKGIFETGCAAGVVPASTTPIGSGAGNYNLEPCIIPIYISMMPLDPVNGTSSSVGYSIVRDATTGRITVSAPGAELGEVISISR